MKEKIKNYFLNIKNLSLKKKIIRLVVLLIIIFIFWNIVKPKRINPDLITIVPVETKDLISTVKSSGSVTSVTDLNLSFKTSDLVQSVNVKVGDRVYKGQVLATLKNGNELGSVTQARAALASAKASLAKTIEGTSTEEIRVAEVALESARTYLYSNSLQAISNSSSSSSTAPTVSGTYTGSSENEYTLSTYGTGAGVYISFTSTSGETGSFALTANSPTKLGSYGLFVTFPTSSFSSNESWIIKVPNTASSSYSSNLNAFNNAKANLDLKKSAVKSVDVDLKQAEVMRAEGQLQSALGIYENTIIRAPSNGTITKMELKVGELAKALETVIVVQDVGNLYVESNINESNITEVAIGQKVDLTIDAYGPNEYFTGVVTQVEPGATITDGIVNYKIKVSLDKSDKKVKPGMNANLVITTGKKDAVLAIPNASVTKRDNQNYVLVITNEKKKSYKEVPVTTGIVGSGNLVEIVSGLNVGDKVALVEKAS